MTDWSDGPPATVMSAGLGCRCPRCGRGKLFDGFLELGRRCDHCGLDYTFADAGDGPAVFIILLVGFLIVAGALTLEVMYAPPFWVHAVIWLPLTTLLAVGLLRPFKAVMVALQYQNQAREGRLADR